MFLSDCIEIVRTGLDYYSYDIPFLPRLSVCEDKNKAGRIQFWISLPP